MIVISISKKYVLVDSAINMGYIDFILSRSKQFGAERGQAQIKVKVLVEL